LLTKDQVLRGLRELGLKAGMVVMVQGSVEALGEVEGGADTVIAALLEAVGPEGTVAMPAMAPAGQEVFDVEHSPSASGALSEAFRHWPGVRRSLHPTHSVCALGPQAEALIAGHLDEPSAVGPGSPWGKLARLSQGYVLLLGVDQNANTLLHYAEEIVDAPYLEVVTRDYRDPATGEVKSKQLCRFAQGHRDFIGLDRLFLEGGAMTLGRVGTAVCRLMQAGKTVELALAALQRDPTAMLCTNPRCLDCLRGRAAVRRAQLAEESFTLTAVVDDLSAHLEDLPRALAMLKLLAVQDVELGAQVSGLLVRGGEGAQLSAAEALMDAAVRAHSVAWRLPSEAWTPGDLEEPRAALELAERLGARKLVLQPTPPSDARSAPEWRQAAVEFLAELERAARAAEVEVLVENVPGSPLASGADCEALFADAPFLQTKLAFNPAHFAQLGERPLTEVYVRPYLQGRVRQVYVCDGCRWTGSCAGAASSAGRGEGKSGAGSWWALASQPYTLPGQGEGQVKDLISLLRCRCFSGSLCLRVGWGTGEEAVRQQVRAFWHLLDNM
jgi:aminoglycoside 3-N-acetyltransferase